MRRLRLPVALLLLLPPSGAHAAAAVRAGVSGQAAPATVPALGVAPPSSLGSIGELTLPSALDSAALTPAQPVMTVAGAAEASPASLPMGETAVNAVGALEEPPVAASWLPSRPEREELGPRPDVRALKRAGVTVSNRAAPERTASPYYAARFERNANPIREAVAALAHADGSTPDGLYSLGRRAEDAMTGVRAAESGKPEPVPQPGAAPSAPANDLSPAPPVSPAAVPAASPAAPASVKPLPPADAPKKSRLRAILGWPAAFGKRLYRMLMGDPEMKPFLKKYRVQFWTAQGVQLLFSILGVTVAWGMGRLIDLAVDGRDLPNGLKLMIAASGLLLMINVVYATVEWVQNWLEERIDIQFVADIRQHLFKHLTALPLPVLRRHKSQQLSTRLIDDVSELGQKNITLPFHMPFHIYEIVFNAAMLFAVNVKLGWGLLAMLPLFAWLSAHFGRKLETLSEAATDKRAAMAERSGDLLASIEVLRAFGVEPQAHDSFSEAVQDYTKVKLDENVVSTWYQTLSSTLGDLATKILVIALGAWALFMWGEPSVGTLTSMQAYAFALAAAIEAFSHNWTTYREADGSTRRVLDLLAQPAEAPDAPDAVELGPIQGRVRVHNVVFAYSKGDRNILRGVSFDAEPGQTIALVGETGSGKTTFLRLLARLYDPKRGSISIDGHDLRKIRRTSFNRQIALVPQDSGLLNGTIRQNLKLVAPNADEAKMREALEAAHAGFVFDVASFPEGLDTDIGDKGVRLSGGQKQRIAIARAILRDPRLLLLDEATASLDNESERLVQDALRRLMKGRTTFVVAHRLTTIQSADKILVFDRGHIVEWGTHEELLKQGGKYAALVKAATAHSEQPE